MHVVHVSCHLKRRVLCSRHGKSPKDPCPPPAKGVVMAFGGGARQRGSREAEEKQVVSSSRLAVPLCVKALARSSQGALGDIHRSFPEALKTR